MAVTDERPKKSACEGRRTRSMEDRAITRDRKLSEDDRAARFRQLNIQSALPDLPKSLGWHTCWHTIASLRDSIKGLICMGYEPIKPEDVPGWEYATLKTGDWAGFIGVNEMLAFKLPMDLYGKYKMLVNSNVSRRDI